LYVVSPIVDERGLHDAYLQVHAALSRLESADLTTANIRFVGARDPLAQVLESILLQRPKTRGITWAGPWLADIRIDDAYIYPRPTSPVGGGRTMTTDEVLRAVTDLMARTGQAKPAVVALRDHTSFQGIPFGLEKNNDVLALKFIEAGSGSVRTVPVLDVVSVT
jgi:hypothetical protein